jgi:hypothetical protein
MVRTDGLRQEPRILIYGVNVELCNFEINLVGLLLLNLNYEACIKFL